MSTINYWDNKLIKANRLISYGDSSTAKEIIEDILSEVLDCVRAPNQLGMIFYHKSDDKAWLVRNTCTNRR